MKSNHLATTLITAYAVNPYKGSEDGTGWNILIEIAKHQKVIAITRENNQEAIDRYFSENNVPQSENIQFEYFDLPYYLRFWKRKSKGALLYCYLWQIAVVFFIYARKIQFDVAHHLNFHSDWMPSFLWVFGKPFIWGPVGHHPKIPRDFILKTAGIKGYIQDRLKWYAKKMFWTFDPFLKITKWKASKIICINSSVAKVLNLPKKKVVLLPAVATQTPSNVKKNTNEFKVLSIGRFVHLKAFDLTIKSFAKFYQGQSISDQSKLKLILIGKGPLKKELQDLAAGLKIEHAVKFIDWIDRADLDQYFANASAFLFPSHEGAGMVVPEALSFGVPVLCLDNVGPGESIDQFSGVKVEHINYEHTIDELSNELNDLYRKPSYQKALSIGAQVRFYDAFTWERKGKLIADLYRKDETNSQVLSRELKADDRPKKVSKVVCTHLYNDFSGSPLVLSTVIKGFIEKGVEVELLTSNKEEGFLSNLPIRYIGNKYTFAENKLIRIIFFFFTQFLSFCKMWQFRNQNVIVYVNTLLPFGVAIAGKMMNKKVVYHVHETSVKPAILKNFLKWVAAKTASEVIYVSNFLKNEEPIGDVPSTVIYNALSKGFVKSAKKYKKDVKSKSSFTVLMLCSLKDYKGVMEFVNIAAELPNCSFELVLNADMKSINEYFKSTILSNNLTLFPKQNNVHPFYQRADVVLNLSHPEQWVETFGMTLLEGMEYGIPAISPQVGGCTEFVQNGVNGFQIDQRETLAIAKQIKQLWLDKKLYTKLSKNAKKMAQGFSVAYMGDSIFRVVI